MLNPTILSEPSPSSKGSPLQGKATTEEKSAKPMLNESTNENTEVAVAPAAATKKSVVFTGHNSYMMQVARMNREQCQFTDAVFVCADGKVHAHKLVLAAASSTLREAFLEVPSHDVGLEAHVVLVPEVKKSIVTGLVDFLYTVCILFRDMISGKFLVKASRILIIRGCFPLLGHSNICAFLSQGKLVLSRSNARDMQLLVRLLGIDPENVRVEALEDTAKTRLTQTQLTTSMGLIVKKSPLQTLTGMLFTVFSTGRCTSYFKNPS